MKFVVMFVLVTLAQLSAGVQFPYGPAAKKTSSERQGLVDFALKGINPQSTDYGCRIDEARKLLVDGTIKSLNSWAAGVALSLLALAFCLLIHQHQERNRRECIAARLLSQYHNGWVEARARAEDSILRHNELVEKINVGTETRLVRPDLSQDPTGRSDPAQRPAVQTAVDPSAKPDRGSNVIVSADSVRQKREPEVDFISQISTLQQQLTASHERERNLQKELTKAQRRTSVSQTRGSNPSS
jgi:hypothetical protein